MGRSQSFTCPKVLIGVISDTHGLMRSEALNNLKGVDIIFHVGDIGGIGVLSTLEEIAPVVAVRGNCDRDLNNGIPGCCKIEIINNYFLLIHNLHDLKELPGPVDAVIFGHSHKSTVYVKDNVLYLNPGSAGPKRFRSQVTVARIRIENEKLIPEIIELF